MLSLFLAPLPWLDGPCDDPRYPVLDGAWAVGCGSSGRVERALNLDTGERVELSDALDAPAVGGGVIYVAGTRGGLWRLPAGEEDPEMVRIPVTGHAPPATDGHHVVVVTEDDLQVLELGERSRYHTEGWPAPWYAPAISGRWLGWVDVRALDERGEDVLVWDREARELHQLAVGPLDERHVALDGDHAAWVDDEGVTIAHLVTGERQRVASDPRPTNRLSLSDGIACWEAWNGADVDVVCSDGVTVDGDGDQRTPSRVGDRILYVDAERTFLATVER